MMTRRRLIGCIARYALLPAFIPQITAARAADTHGLRCSVFYYSWFDNTDVTGLRPADIDAVTGASLTAPGLVTQVAGWIAGEVGVTAHPITAAQPYPSDYDRCLDQVVEEKLRRFRPELAPTTTDAMRVLKESELIFLGFPNWSYTLPMTVMSFLERADWRGKTIAPFCVHGTGGLARTTSDLRRTVGKEAQVLSALSLEREEVPQGRGDTLKWLEASLRAAVRSGS